MNVGGEFSVASRFLEHMVFNVAHFSWSKCHDSPLGEVAYHLGPISFSKKKTNKQPPPPKKNSVSKLAKKPPKKYLKINKIVS